MNLIKQLITSRLAIAGIVFLVVNTTTSYMFYQVNSYKILLAIIGITLLALSCELLFYKSMDKLSWKDLSMLLLPLLATIPGYIFYKGQYNYNFSYELVTNLTLILWVVYICRTTQSEDDLPVFITLLGVAVIYGCLWGILEKLGYFPSITGEGNLQISTIWLVLKKFLYNPLDWNISFVDKVKSAFGHRNYFSGFLILLLPIFLIFSIPEETKGSSNKVRFKFTKNNIFSLTVFLMGIVTLLAAQTRAAIGAFGFGLILSLSLYYVYFRPVSWRKRPLIPIAVLLGFSVLAVLLMFLFFNKVEQTRILELFTFRGWAGRLLPWQTAVSSIKASPFVGFGLGSSYNLFFYYVNPDARLFHHERSYNHAHSEILEYLQESGALGLLAYLIFWGYIIFKLFKILRTSSSQRLTKLAIGICGAFLAYHIHSTFSVAPRMVVTKLPLFTLFALVFVSSKLLVVQKNANTANFKEKWAIIISSFLIIASVWVIYIPWIKGQYGFVKIEQKRPSLLKVLELEELVQSYSDIYALDRLSYYQIQYKRTDQLRRSIKEIENIIPKYRELGFKKLILAVLENNLKEAKEVGLKFQNADRYYLSGINLLTRLAFKTGDYQVFSQQFKIIMKFAMFQSGWADTKDSSKVQIEIKKNSKNLIVEEKGDSLLIIWNENFTKWLFGRGLQLWGHSNEQYRQILGVYLRKIFLSHPYFQASSYEFLNKEEAKEVESNMRGYTEISNKLGGAKTQRLKDEYRAQMETHRKFVESKTGGKSFFARRRFIEIFVKQLNSSIFQSSK